jgi:hypothetical protein
VQSGIKRALLDLQDFVGVVFDTFGSGVAVSRAEKQGTEDEKIAPALEEFNVLALPFGRRSR